MPPPADAAPGRLPRSALADVAVVAVAALALRLFVCDGRELWFDDIGRLRSAMLDWDGLWTKLPWNDWVKSVYAVAAHKAWVTVAGTGSILEIRGYSAVLGAVQVALALRLAQVVGGRACGWVVGIWYLANPFFLHWSVEVHQYSVAGAIVLGIWIRFLPLDRIGARAAVAAAVCGGFAVGLFAPVALALLPALLLPGVRAARGVRVWLAAAAAFAIAAGPGLVSIWRSRVAYAPALAAGPGERWFPYYFNPRKTPFEILARMSGLDLRQGAFAWRHAIWAVAVIGAAFVCVLTSRGASRSRRLLLLAAGVGPIIVLAALSGSSALLTDRYAHTVAILLPVAVLCAFVMTLQEADDGRPAAVVRLRRALAAVGLALVATPFALGIGAAWNAGNAFPKGLTSRSYRGVALLAGEMTRSPKPDVILVHGEAQFCNVAIRAPEMLAATDVRHLCTAAWMETERREDMTTLCIPSSYGWPFSIRELIGRTASADRRWVKGRLEEGATVWFVMDDPGIARSYFQDDEEVSGGLDAAFRRLREPPSEGRDADIASAAASYLGAPPGTRTRVVASGAAVVVMLVPR